MKIGEIVKGESIGLLKTIISVSIGIWAFAEPHVEGYVQEQVKIVQEKDKRLIKELSDKLYQEKEYNKTRRNAIVQEINHLYSDSRLIIEK